MRLATLPALFISHGAPTLALEAGSVGAALQRLSSNLPTPTAIVVMSAHWQSHTLEVSTGTRPETWHDFRGFPDELYHLRYPAAGDPALADHLLGLLHSAGLVAHGNLMRPRDHGVWVPLRHLYPNADIPVIQLSIPISFNAAQLHHVGRVLAELRQAQILLIGSGSITHNLHELSRQSPNAPTPEWASSFRQWVVNHLVNDDYDSVLDWLARAPHARRNHPTDEHLSPLFFAMGAGQRFSLVHSSFMFGALGMDIYRFD
jgi:4,5-DOPA dioxygenase extradiol